MMISKLFTMKRLLLFLPVIFLLGGISRPSTYDIIIYGGTSAGVMAAVQSARMGKSVLLISPSAHLGGLSSSGLGWTDLGKSNTIGGLSLEFYQSLNKYYESKDAWRQETREEFISKVKEGNQWDRVMLPRDGMMPVFEPRAAESVFEDFIKKYKIDIVKGKWLNREEGVIKSSGKIRSIKMLSGEVYFGKVFIDATYEGDLMAAAGVSFTVGRESNDQYKEYFNGIRTANALKNQLPPGIDPFVKKGDFSSGLMKDINPGAGGIDGNGDKKIQAYCYRMCLTNDPSNRVMVQKPVNYKEPDFEIVLRAAESGWATYFKLDRMPNKKTDSNNSGGISTDYIGMNYNYPEASYAERNLIEKAHIYWQAGLIWTLQNHPRVPDSIRNRYKEWGLAKDEFTDNDHWPYQIYVREGRRMVSDLVITEHYCLNEIMAKRPIALGSYTMDSHNVQRYLAKNEKGAYYIRNEGDVQNPVAKPYPIDYGSIVPRKVECTNLIVPVCLSASHIAYGSIRMEPVFMMLGQSAATAAAISIENNVPVQDIKYSKLKERLLKNKMILIGE